MKNEEIERLEKFGLLMFVDTIRNFDTNIAFINELVNKCNDLHGFENEEAKNMFFKGISNTLKSKRNKYIAGYLLGQQYAKDNEVKSSEVEDVSNFLNKIMEDIFK